MKTLPLYHDSGSEPSTFVVLSTQNDAFSLSPQVMQYDAQSWIADLKTVKLYWQDQCRRAQKSFPQVLIERLRQSQADQPFQVVVCKNPWQGLLALTYLKERDLQGLFNLESTFGKNLYNNISWSAWFEAAEGLSKFFPLHYKRFKEAKFFADLNKFQQAIHKLDVQFSQSKQLLNAASIKRRFGGFVGMIWAWTLGESSTGFIEEFPWQDFEPPLELRVTRHLEYPLMHWQPIEPFLKDDLNLLCQLSTWNESYLVDTLLWKIIFHDLSFIVVPIHFRYPHKLHRDRPEHKIALSQIHLNFENVRTELSKKNLELHLPEESLIVGWELKVQKWMFSNNSTSCLFEDFTEQNAAAIEKLANQLAVKMERYQIKRDFVPEQSFSRESAGPYTDDDVSNNPLLCSDRPLFIWDKPHTLERPLRNKTFLERVSLKWWERSQTSSRNYYKAMTSSNTLSWVYQDSSGKWYEHGIYT
ncbi:MAG: hypothetical protein AB7T49_00890 [Oligoflexales bacterium]